MNKKLLPYLCVFLCVFLLKANISVPVPHKSVTIKNVDGYAKFVNNSLYSEPGCPLLPSKSYTFLVPPDVDLSDVSFHIQGLKEKAFESTCKVKPAPPPCSIDGPVWPDNRNIVNGKDINIYSKNEYYPKNYINDISVGKMRCYKIVKVRVYFSQYNPVTGKLKYLTDGKLVLDVERKSQIENTQYLVPAIFNKFAKNITINYDDIAPTYNSAYSFTRKTTYVILTESSIQSGSGMLENFKKSKEDRGFDVSIVTENDWGGGTGETAANNIRAWLKTNYQEMSIEYALLIGSSIPSSGAVPMYGSTPTDFYYQDIDKEWDQMDGLAEVIGGRIPVYNNDITALDGILKKTIDYENAPKSEIAWRAFCFIAESPYDPKTPGYPLFEEIKTKFLDPQGWGNYRIYDVSNGNPDESSCNYTAVKNAWNELKFGLMLWMTHGSPKKATDIIETSTMETFSDEYPSIVFMGSCSNATITTTDNLTYTALKYACIGAIGGTVMTWYEDEQVDNFEGTSATQGFLWHYAKGIAVDSLGAGAALAQTVAEGDKRYNVKAYNLFGCPEVGVYSCMQLTPINNKSMDKGISTDFLAINHLLPASHTIQISYSLAKANFVNLKIFNMLGKEVQTLVNKFQPANSYSINFNTQKYSSGIYFYTLQVGKNFNKTKRMIVVQ